jgi:hypothetical protein
MMDVEIVPYGGWERCLRIRNDQIEAVITAEVGPRVIRFGFIGGVNEFVEYPAQMGRTGGEDYRSYGGHRLWVAPEERARTYVPDNRPVRWSVEGEALRVIAPVEDRTGLQKELEFWIDQALNTVHVVHRITNRAERSQELAAWALSVMAPGGTALLPQEPHVPHTEQVLPSRPLVLWSYTDMTDPRWTWGKELIRLRQDPAAAAPQKVGVQNRRGWMAYANGDRLFVKTNVFIPGAAYPDFGCNAELFTNAAMLELETLSPLVSLPPGGMIQHEEHWFLYRGFRLGRSEAEIAAALRRLQ